MRFVSNLLILCLTLNSYGTEIVNDTIPTIKIELIDYKKELKKFKDSISESTYPIIFSKEYSKLNREIIIENTDNLDKLYKISSSNLERQNQSRYKIKTFGSISRGFSIGNNQNSVLNSELDLQISGKLSENISIKASIQDSNIPLQNNGYSQQIDEFDQIFIEIASRDWKIRGGDINLSENESFFGNFQKRIQGLAVNSKLDNFINFEVAGAIVKGKYKKTEIQAQNGNQGPYKLIGQNGELFVLVVSGSESVFINGKKIKRGIDKDYVINYNAGEIIFNSTYPIMADMRINVEYQVSEKNYNSFIGYTKVKIKKKRFTHNISFYNENDIKDQPLLQNVSENRIEILSNAGDNIELMSAPTGTLTTFHTNRILYKKEVINNEEIFIYSNNEEDELYEVNFTNVGQNKGDYIIITNNAIDNIYEYIPRINGEKQGNFDPIVKLIAPEKLQLLVYNSTYEMKNNSKLNIELATSKKDNNLFSAIDDSDNEGLASKINYQSENKTKNFNIKTNLDINYLDNNFQTIERIYNTEFNRDWDFIENISNDYNQLFSKATVELNKKKTGSLLYKFENLSFEDYYSGTRNSISIISEEDRKIMLSSISSIMDSKQNNYSSQFIVTKNKIDVKYKSGWAELIYNVERKKGNGNVINILRPDFGEQLYELKKGFGIKDKSFVEIGYRKKTNDSILNGNLDNVNSYDSYFINSQLLNNEKTKLNIFINQNKYVSINNQEKEDFLNTRLIYNQRAFKNIIESNLFFETNSVIFPNKNIHS